MEMILYVYTGIYRIEVGRHRVRAEKLPLRIVLRRLYISLDYFVSVGIGIEYT